MEITSKTAWGGRDTNVPNKIGPLSRVYIHHTAGYLPVNVNEETQQMRTLQHLAIDVKEYTEIDYNWVIGPSGIVYEARGLGKKSAATLSQNDVSRSVCLMGNFQNDTPTKASLEAAVETIKFLIDNGDLSPTVEILGHRDNPVHPGATACPGNNLYAHMDEIRKAVQTHIPVGDEDMLKARFLRQKGYINVFVVGGGFPVLHMSGELMESLEKEDPSIPKIFFDNMAAMNGLCTQAGEDIDDPTQVVPGGPSDRF